MGADIGTCSGWAVGQKVVAANFCAFLQAQAEYKDELSIAGILPAQRQAEHNNSSLSNHMCEKICSAYSRRGVNTLYRHQAVSLEQIRHGRHMVLSTKTASGKSLVYTVATLEAVNHDLCARSFFIFPTKALAQDQLGSLRKLADEACPRLYACTFDGDTPQIERTQLRQRAHVFFTNPDTLHASILPNAVKEWGDVLRNLKFVVIDEAHAYRGAFGSHVSMVLRRLRRMCAKLGSFPQFIACSATIANPRAHVSALLGLCLDEIELIEQDGAPSGAKTVAIWNPPPLPRIAVSEWFDRTPPGSVKTRVSAISEAAKLLALLVTHEIRTIAFARTRFMAESILLRTRELLPPHLGERVASYRAGYTASRRRELESALFSGSLLAVAATSALELGVNVGSIDATLHVGVPATAASFLQQAGRAGRNGQATVSIVVAQSNPLDQYFASCNSKALLQRPLESVLIRPMNESFLRPHLIAASKEAPLQLPPKVDKAQEGKAVTPKVEPEPNFGSWLQWSAAATAAVVKKELVIHGELLKPTQSGLDIVRDIDLRGMGRERISLVRDTNPPEELETMELLPAMLRLYKGAVYLHGGQSFLVDDLSLENKVARCHREDTAYFTEPRDHARVEILGRDATANHELTAPAYSGPMKVFKSVYGYRKKSRSDGRLLELIDFEESLPAHAYDTRGIWIEPPSAVRDDLVARGHEYARGALHAIEHMLVSLAPLVMACENDELGCQCTRRRGDTHSERIVLFEKKKGALGISGLLLHKLDPLLLACQQRLKSCTCQDGCPSCIFMPGCGEYNEGLEKAGAIALLGHLNARSDEGNESK